MRARTIVKWIVIIAATFLSFKVGQAAAFAERGYKAVGGEFILLLLPFLWWMIERSIKDTKAILKPPPEDTASKYALTGEKTNYILCRCFDCERDSVYWERTGDGRSCLHCGGRIAPRGYAKKHL